MKGRPVYCSPDFELPSNPVRCLPTTIRNISAFSYRKRNAKARGTPTKELNPLGPAWFNGESSPILLQVRDTRHTVENLCPCFVKYIAVNQLKRICPKVPSTPARTMRHVDNGSGLGAFGCRRVVKSMSSICGRELTISGQIWRNSVITALKFVHRKGWRSLQAAGGVNNFEAGAHGIWSVF